MQSKVEFFILLPKHYQLVNGDFFQEISQVWWSHFYSQFRKMRLIESRLVCFNYSEGIAHLIPPRRAVRLIYGHRNGGAISPRRVRKYASLLSGRFAFFSVCLGVHASGFSAGNLRNRLPSRYTLQNALGIFRRRDVAVVILDHLDRGTHLLGKEIDIHTFHQSEGGIGMPQAIGAPAAAG